MREEDGHGDAGFSILNLHEPKGPGKDVPAYFQDLNLETVLDLLAAKGGKAVREYYRALPETAEDTAYRRAVYGDVKKEDVYLALTSFVDRLAEAEMFRKEKERLPSGLQRAVWLLRETEVWCAACARLEEALQRADLSSEGMRRFRGILRNVLESGAFREMRGQVDGIMREIRGTRLVITCERDRIRVEPVKIPADGEGLPEKEQKPLQNPFFSSLLLTEFERECLDVLRKKKPALFQGIGDAAKRCESYENPVLARFGQEIRFYLSYRALQRELEEKGFRFAVPEEADDRLPGAEALYDLALACVFAPTGKPVVANDFHYEEGERFFVLTGPNQGGKTTFARSLGQLIYLARIGLDVPARSARVPFFPDIQTHFSVEESVETGRGKLKEELVRLAPMMEAKRHGTFVVINELFTTAANYDAQIMGKKVLEHFIGLDCMGIYVTHLKELAKAHPRVVSLRAALDEKGIPTFRILRGEAPDTASAENQVKKYRLTYAQLKERL